jgi:hypothetical protein
MKGIGEKWRNWRMLLLLFESSKTKELRRENRGHGLKREEEEVPTETEALSRG